MRYKVDLGVALIACMVAIAVSFSMPFAEFFHTVWNTTFDLPAPPPELTINGGIDLTAAGWWVFNKDTWQVLLLVIFILALSKLMKESGALDDLVESVRNIFVDNRFVIGALPALIGLLPMPGGALVSAPMIDGPSDEAGLSPEDRTYLNYWFRHVWEYSYPLYPGLILLSIVIDIDITTIITTMFPLSLAAILAGSLFGLIQIPKHFRDQPTVHEVGVNLRRFLRGFWPVLVIFIVLLGINPILRDIESLNGFTIDFIYVLIVVVPLFGLISLGPKKMFQVLKSSINWKIVLTIYAVLLFKDIINASGAVIELSTVLTKWGVPSILLLMVLPWIIGYLNGITHAYVSVAFLLLLPFLTGPDGEADMAKVQFAYTWGFIGVLFSPVHLCLVMSVNYFDADLPGVLKKMLLPAALLGLVSFVFYYAWL